MDWNTTFSPLPLSSQDALPSLAIAPLESWALIQATGQDSKSYLQGQLTCDVVTLAQDEVRLGAHCDAKGKVWSAFHLFHHQQGYGMFQPKALVEKEIAELKKYAIFSKVEFSESPLTLLGVMGSAADAFIDTLTQERGDVRSLREGSAVRIGQQRWVVITNEETAFQIVDAFEGQKSDESLWRLYDIQSASPSLTQTQQNEHIPQALNLQALGGISFTKGCYTGQETVARAKYRGINKRALFILKGQCDAVLEENAELERAVGDNWRSAGHVLASYQYTDGVCLALAVLPNNLEAETPFRFKHLEHSRLTFAPLPYSLDEA